MVAEGCKLLLPGLAVSGRRSHNDSYEQFGNGVGLFLAVFCQGFRINHGTTVLPMTVV